MDSNDQTDEVWLLGIQRKLYQWSRKHPQTSYNDLWNWVTDDRNLRCAWRRIAANKGRRTAGIDGVTVASIRAGCGEQQFLADLRTALQAGCYQPKPSRRKYIPKRGKPGKFRPLGIPTVSDRVVQCAVKQIVEPIFEAHFSHVSYGFRPGRGCHGALEHIRMALRPRAKASDGRRHQPPYPWVIEGDIKGCFDHINHHLLMNRIRARIGDSKVQRLILQFLKAGVLEDGIAIPTHAGTPQGGVISPLLANIALSVIEDKYERWVEHRKKITPTRKCDGITAARRSRSVDRKRGVPVFFPIRSADDFVILVSGSREDAEVEKRALSDYLQHVTGLELSDEKTRISSAVHGFEFLGTRVRLKWHRRFGYSPRLEIPKHKQADLRYAVRQLATARTNLWSLSKLLQRLNPILRGWANYYRFCTGAHRVFSRLDFYVGDRIWRWLMYKHKGLPRKRSTLVRLPSSTRPTRKVWRDARTEQFPMDTLRVERFKRGWMLAPAFTVVPGEPSA